MHKKGNKIVNQNLVNVWHNTIKYFNDRPRHVPDSTKFSYVTLTEPLAVLQTYNPTIEIINEDTFNMSIEYIKGGFNPLVLNMASCWNSGGGVAKGSTAQEEELFRRSNAHLTHHRTYYPLKPDEIIYSPQVTIARMSRDNDYKFTKETVVSMIACAAIKNPNLHYDKFTQADWNLSFNKIKSIFLTAIAKGHDSLVLGALGCGAYNNPPKEVAKIFKMLVDDYGKYFKRIGFAILIVRDNDKNNFSAFVDEFKN